MGAHMSDAFADFTARLEQLLAAIMKEKRPEKCDELAAEIWRVLAESDSAKKRVLRGQVKTGQRRSGQNRPTEVAWD